MVHVHAKHEIQKIHFKLIRYGDIVRENNKHVQAIILTYTYTRIRKQNIILLRVTFDFAITREIIQHSLFLKFISELFPLPYHVH